jgi:hypothetical protein
VLFTFWIKCWKALYAKHPYKSIACIAVCQDSELLSLGLTDKETFMLLELVLTFSKASAYISVLYREKGTCKN